MALLNNINNFILNNRSEYDNKKTEMTRSVSFRSLFNYLESKNKPAISIADDVTGNNGNSFIQYKYCGDCLLKNKLNEYTADSIKVQIKLNTDINRIAKLMGIGPKTFMSAIGGLNIDPSNYDFKIQTNIDAAVSSIAEYFGISPMTTLAILDKLKIDPNELEYKGELGKIISKLQEFFGLDVKQEKELRDILSKYIKDDK